VLSLMQRMRMCLYVTYIHLCSFIDNQSNLSKYIFRLCGLAYLLQSGIDTCWYMVLLQNCNTFNCQPERSYCHTCIIFD